MLKCCGLDFVGPQHLKTRYEIELKMSCRNFPSRVTIAEIYLCLADKNGTVKQIYNNQFNPESHIDAALSVL